MTRFVMFGYRGNRESEKSLKAGCEGKKVLKELSVFNLAMGQCMC